LRKTATSMCGRVSVVVAVLTFLMVVLGLLRRVWLRDYELCYARPLATFC
jgi:hypothetical protein